MGRQRNRKGGSGHGPYKEVNAGEKREREEGGDGGVDANNHRPDRNVWRTDIRDPSTLSNPLFESYYKRQVFFNKEVALATGWLKEGASEVNAARPGEQRIVHDWETFHETLKQPLPSAIRINSNHPDRLLVRDMLFRELQQIGMTLVDESGLAAKQKASKGDDSGAQQEVYPLNYVPEGLAFQLDLSKGELKRDTQFKRVKKIIAALNEGGYLTRQEAVSMIPPLMLDVQPGMRVLDMCAAPGSKTSQLLEAVIRGGYVNTPVSKEVGANSIPLDNFMTPLEGGGADAPAKGGCVVANDVNIARIDVLHHQTGRAAHSHPNLIVTNNDATNYPLFPQRDPASNEPDPKFDRVLCDVMCSGDGTLRKSIDLWVRWNPLQGADLHCSQLKTLLRGMSLVKAGGVVVYSTCSMNPIEDEAVVAEALLSAHGHFELIDKFSAGTGLVPELLQGLKYSPGVTDWTLSSRDGTRNFECFADAVNYRKEETKGRGFNFRPSMFPPHKQAYPEGHKAQYPDDREPATYEVSTPSNFQEDPLNLHRCIRVLPHQQNTGGFFIAAFRCLKDYNFEEQRRLIKERRQAAYQERTGVVGDGAASLAKTQEQLAAQAAESRFKRDPLYSPIPADMQECVRAVLPSINGDATTSALPLSNLFIRHGQGLDKTDDAGDEFDKTGSRNVKVFLGTKEAAQVVLDFPRGVIVKQIGAKVMESYVKYHPEKLRVWPETLDTLMPYFGSSQQAATSSPSIGITYLLNCDASWLFSLIAGQAITLPSGVVQSGKARVTLDDIAAHCNPLSVVVGANGRTGIQQPQFQSKEECDQRLPPKSFILVVPISSSTTASDSTAPNALAGFHPLNISCEFDDGRITASIKITPHQLSMLQLYVTGDNTAVVGEKKAVAEETTTTADATVVDAAPSSAVVAE